VTGGAPGNVPAGRPVGDRFESMLVRPSDGEVDAHIQLISAAA